MGLLESGTRCPYEKLRGNSRWSRSRSRRWVKRTQGRRCIKKGIHLSRSTRGRGLLSFIVLPLPTRIVSKLYSRLVAQLEKLCAAGVYPSIIFSTQWGLPVLSHSSL